MGSAQPPTLLLPPGVAPSLPGACGSPHFPGHQRTGQAAGPPGDRAAHRGRPRPEAAAACGLTKRGIPPFLVPGNSKESFTRARKKRPPTPEGEFALIKHKIRHFLTPQNPPGYGATLLPTISLLLFCEARACCLQAHRRPGPPSRAEGPRQGPGMGVDTRHNRRKQRRARLRRRPALPAVRPAARGS